MASTTEAFRNHWKNTYEMGVENPLANQSRKHMLLSITIAHPMLKMAEIQGPGPGAEHIYIYIYIKYLQQARKTYFEYKVQCDSCVCVIKSQVYIYFLCCIVSGVSYAYTFLVTFI